MEKQVATSAPKRRWFRFSLRGLLVIVTVFGCWLGWQISAIHLRRSTAERIEAEGGFVEVWVKPEPIQGNGELGLTYGGGERVLGPEREPEIPEWRRWLDDQAFNQITLPSGWTESDLVRARALFPEARVDGYEQSNGMGQF